MPDASTPAPAQQQPTAQDTIGNVMKERTELIMELYNLDERRAEVKTRLHVLSGATQGINLMGAAIRERAESDAGQAAPVPAQPTPAPAAPAQ